MDAKSISKILFQHWDPIKVNEIAPEDEYDHYAECILKIIEEGGSAVQIQDYLARARKVDLMSAPNEKNDSNIVDMIFGRIS